jgi:hypothetical protein
LGEVQDDTLSVDGQRHRFDGVHCFVWRIAERTLRVEWGDFQSYLIICFTGAR